MRRPRLQEHRLGQRLLTGSTDPILLFDEMEDLLLDPEAFRWMDFMRRVAWRFDPRAPRSS